MIMVTKQYLLLSQPLHLRRQVSPILPQLFQLIADPLHLQPSVEDGRHVAHHVVYRLRDHCLVEELALVASLYVEYHHFGAEFWFRTFVGDKTAILAVALAKNLQ